MRRRRLEADIVTPEFIVAALNCQPVRRLTREAIGKTRQDRIEYEFEIIAQFRGPIIAHSPLMPGTRYSVNGPEEVCRQLLEPWHIRDDRPASKVLTSCFTLCSIHTVPVDPRGILRCTPSIYDPKERNGDLCAILQLRKIIQADHRPEAMRPIGIELRVRADRNCCSIFQERARVSLRRLTQLNRRLKAAYRLNGRAKEIFAQYGFNLIESSVGQLGFSLTPAELDDFAFAPGFYSGK